MVMLRNRKMVQYLIHHLPSIIGRRQTELNKSINGLMEEMKHLYRKLRTYDRIIDNIGKVGI